jgi:hypothetical protein
VILSAPQEFHNGIAKIAVGFSNPRGILCATTHVR